MDIARDRLNLKFIKADDTDKNKKKQSNLTFNGINKSYENCNSFTFKQNEVLKNKPIYLGFFVLELSIILMYETFYEKLEACFGQENIHLLLWILIVSY